MNQDIVHASEDRILIDSGYRYALSLAHNAHDAEDLIQQACLRVYKSRGKLVSKSYLFTAVRNLFIDQSRRRSLVKTEPLPAEEVTDSAPSHTQTIESRETIQHLLGGLRTEEREALFLNCVEGFTAAEIGELTGQPRGSVLSLLSRAKKKLTNRHHDTNDMNSDRHDVGSREKSS